MPNLGTEATTVQHPLTRYASQVGWTIVSKDAANLHERKRAALSDLFQTLLHQLMTAQIRVHSLDIDTSEVTA